MNANPSSRPTDRPSFLWCSAKLPLTAADAFFHRAAHTPGFDSRCGGVNRPASGLPRSQGGHFSQLVAQAARARSLPTAPARQHELLREFNLVLAMEPPRRTKFCGLSASIRQGIRPRQMAGVSNPCGPRLADRWRISKSRRGIDPGGDRHGSIVSWPDTTGLFSNADPFPVACSTNPG